MIRFNRRGWIISIRIRELADLEPELRTAALALQVAIVADGLVDNVTFGLGASSPLTGGARRGSCRSFAYRQARPVAQRRAERGRAFAPAPEPIRAEPGSVEGRFLRRAEPACDPLKKTDS